MAGNSGGISFKAIGQNALLGSIIMFGLMLLGMLPFVGFIFCCATVFFYGVVGAGYPFFARRAGVYGNAGSSLLGGVASALGVALVQSFIVTLLFVAVYESGLLDEAQTSSFGGFQTQSVEYTLPLVLASAGMVAVFLMFSGAFLGAIGAVLYDAVNPPPEPAYPSEFSYPAQTIDSDWGV